MKLNYFLILIICVLLLCFNIYIFKRNSTSDRIQDTIIRLVNEDSVKKSSHRIEREIRNYELRANGKVLNPSLEVFDTNGNKRTLSKIIDGNKLVLRYSELNCNTCVNKQIELLNLYVDSIGADHIILLTNYDSNFYMKQFKRISKIKYPIFNIGANLNECIPDIERPYFFIIDSNFRINSTYVPQIDESSVTKTYLRQILQYYFRIP